MTAAAVESAVTESQQAGVANVSQVSTWRLVRQALLAALASISKRSGGGGANLLTDMAGLS